jgi:hypothetical protein
MSNTYNDKKFGRLHALQQQLGFYEGWKEYHRVYKRQLYSHNWYTKGPSWHNRMFNNVPARRQTKSELRKAVRGQEEGFDFPNWKKPYNYYY